MAELFISELLINGEIKPGTAARDSSPALKLRSPLAGGSDLLSLATARLRSFSPLLQRRETEKEAVFIAVGGPRMGLWPMMSSRA